MRITWLAAADARGHLMRAHLVRTLLARRDITVDIVTTSEAGRAFLTALGTPSTMLSPHYCVAFDEWQNMARAQTEKCLVRYFLSPHRAYADLRRLDALSRGASLVVNDFHPLLLFAGLRRQGPPVVHVYGEHLWAAIAGNFAGRAPRFVDEGFSSLLRTVRDRSFARIEHTFNSDAVPSGGRSYRLLPIVAAPRRSPAEVRAALGVGARQRLAAVYLNPHFADETLASTLEEGLRRHGFAMYAVGEGFAGRPGWRAYDASFVDVASAADMLVAAPGMGSIGAARLFGVPLLALLTDQPEQRANLAFLRAVDAPPFATVALDERELPLRLDGALGDLATRSPSAIDRPDAARRTNAVHRRWTDVLDELANAA